jgi:F-type H+-transporting ATPase subunit b
MNRESRRWPCAAAIVLVCTVLGVVAAPGWAAGADADWRPTYDLAMRWVNFAILVGVLVYFGRRPVGNLLRIQVARYESEIQRLEAEKAAALERLASVKQLQAENEGRFVELTQRIVALGEQRREAIIEDARRESELLIDEAHRRISFSLRSAKSQVRADMVDMAVDRALARLPQEINAADNERWLQRFFKGMERLR